MMLREEAIKQYGVYYRIPNSGVYTYRSIMAQECLGDISHHQKVNSSSIAFSSEDELKEYMQHICNVNALRELAKAVGETTQSGMNKALSFIRKVGSDDEKWLKFKKAQKILERVDKILDHSATITPEDRLAAVEEEKRYLEWIYNRESITQTIAEMCDHYKIEFSIPNEDSRVSISMSRLPEKINVASKLPIRDVFIMSASPSIVDGEKPEIQRICIEFDHVSRVDGRILLKNRDQEQYATYYKGIIPRDHSRDNSESSISIKDYSGDRGLEVNSDFWLAFSDKEALVKHIDGIRARVNEVCDDVLESLPDIGDRGSNVLPMTKHNID